MLAPLKEPDYTEMARLSSEARNADQRIAGFEARLFLTDDFEKLLDYERMLEKLYAERRTIGDQLIAASKYRRERD